MHVCAQLIWLVIFRGHRQNKYFVTEEQLLKLNWIRFNYTIKMYAPPTEGKNKRFDDGEKFPTLQEKMIAAIPRGRQQHRVLKIDHPR